MKRLMIRTYRDPFTVASPEDVLQHGWFGGNNNGNLLFSEGSVRALAVDGRVDVTCQPMDEDPLTPEQVNEHFDHLVLPMANAFRPSFRGRLRAYTRLLEQLEIPVTVLGVGAQSDIEFHVEPLAEMDRIVSRFARAVLERSPSIGVRGEFTAKYLRHLGFDEVEVIGCPSMFSNGPQLPTRGLRAELDEDSRIAFNLTPKLDQAPRVARDLLARYRDVTYFPQNERELDLMLWGGRTAFHDDRGKPAITSLGHPLFTSANAHVHLHAATWVEDLAGFDFTLGTRIHGNVAACLAGTPAHLLAADSRTRELAEYFELPYTRLVDLPSPLDLGRLTEGADYEAVGRGHRQRFDRFTAFLEAHDLAHIWQPGAESTWDSRMAGRALPAPVTTGPDTPRDLVARMGWLKSRQDSEVAALRTRLRRQRARIDELEGALEERVARLEQRRGRRWPARRPRG